MPTHLAVAIVKEERAKHVVNQAKGVEAEAAVAVIRFEGKKHITGVIAVNKYNYLTKYLGSLYFIFYILYYNIVIIYKSE
jgi:hypothetical protein